MVFTSWAHTSVTVFAGVVATLATGVAITVGLQMMIRSHNTRKTMSRFKRRKRNAMAAIREAERNLAHTLSPQMALLKGAVLDSVSAAGTPESTPANRNKVVMRLKEMDEMLIRSLERLDAVRPASLAEEILSLEFNDLNIASDIAESNPVGMSETCIVSVEGQASDDSDSGNDSDANTVAESTGYNETNHTTSIISDVKPARASSVSSHETLLETRLPVEPSPKSDTATPIDTSVVSHLLPAATSSFLNAYPSYLFFNTDQLPSKDMDYIKDSVIQLRLRKRSLVKRLQTIASEVDALFEQVAKGMDPFCDILLFAQRPPSDGEDPAATQMPPTEQDADTPSDPAEVYRRIDDLHPLHVAVHAGGTVNIYGMLLLTPRTDHLCTKVSIQVSFRGVSRTLWTDGLVKRGQQRVFAEIQKDVLLETEPFPKSPTNTYIHMPFSFFISTTPEGDCLPITFTSPTASVTYAIRVKVSYTQPNTQFSTTSTYSAPIHVSPPWIAAPPPATPLLGPNEDGIRMVVDSMGSYQGRANVVRTRANRESHESGGLVSNRGSENEEAAYLRPRVLNNLIERRRPQSASLRSFDGSGGDFGRIDVPTEPVESDPASNVGVGMGRGHSIGVLELQRDSGASQGANLLLNRSRSEMSYSPVSPNTFQGAQSDMYYSNRHTLELFRDSDELALEVNSEAIVIAPRTPPMEYTEMDPLAESDSNRLAISPFSESSSASSSSGFENSLVSSGQQTGTELHEQRSAAAALSPSRSPPLYPSTVQSSTVQSSTVQSSAVQSSPISSSPRSPTSMLKKLFKRVDRAKQATNQSSPNSTGRIETPSTSSIPMLSPHPPQRTSVDIVGDHPQRSSSPADSFLEYISAPIYDLPRFRVILPCTMVGPGSRVPIDVMVQSVPHGQVVAAVEAILVAQITCTAFGYTHEELVELATVKEVESAVEGPGLLFKKRMWIQVPDADVLKQYGSRFKAPLIELTHRMVINMYTTRRKIVGKGTKHEEYRLGSVSILLMR
ncbi:hypothetical protein HDU78_001665 [Chytriomyces hyalinus]|nr:hypothetical protein HDU78_001665 [Chytriomyces hyalinus]